MRWDREKKYKGKAQARFLESANEEDIVCLSDYNKGTIIGASKVLSYGGVVKLIPLIPGLSSTALIKKNKL